MKSKLTGKSVLITGGTKGLGFATAQLFAQSGAHVYLSYRSDDHSAQQAALSLQKIGTKCEIIRCDLSEEGAADYLFDQLKTYTSELHYYIHNAAATAFKDLLEIKSHHIDKTMNITVKAFILGVQRATQLMPPGGAIVAISGMDTLKAVPRHALLGAAKSALETLSAYYAHELGPKGIRVNCINPGFFETESTRKYLGPMFEPAQKQMIQLSPLKRAASLEDIANVILFLCSEYSHWIVGQTLKVDGGSDFTLPLG